MYQWLTMAIPDSVMDIHNAIMEFCDLTGFPYESSVVYNIVVGVSFDKQFNLLETVLFRLPRISHRIFSSQTVQQTN